MNAVENFLKKAQELDGKVDGMVDKFIVSLKSTPGRVRKLIMKPNKEDHVG